MSGGSIVAMFFVVLVIVIGIGAAWAITAHGAATPVVNDSFGNGPGNQATMQDTNSTALATATMPVTYIGFFIAICVILVMAFVWMWTNPHKKAKY